MKTYYICRKNMFFNFNPDENFSKRNGIFGLPKEEENAKMIIIPVPWDVTTSYRDGTAYAPEAILEASYQIDLYDPVLPDEWRKGIFYQPFEDNIIDMNSVERRKSKTIIDHLENIDDTLPERLQRSLEEVNAACDVMNNYVSQKIKHCLELDKIPALLGGEHSVSLMAVTEVAKKYQNLGILHFDAHADLRKNYLNFKYSHASVMRNIIETVPTIFKLVQVGIRDICNEEAIYSSKSPKIDTFFMSHINDRLFKGETWQKITSEIIDKLPQHVYISFDIDSLKPSLCPHTGTPVPSGLNFEQVIYMFKSIWKSGRKIVAFDLVEVAPDQDNQWDETIASRLLYQLCIYTFASNR